ncbi:MAG: sodium-dependent transporter [Bacteroidetes bacterium]|nr:sodium-dependent transporter [Bacteroidota bacterium]
MAETTPPQWSSRYMFLLASIGSTVGLSNIWKFTYLAGENGGGAFVLIYLLSLMVMGIPILAAELMIGRRGRKSMVGTMRTLAQLDGISCNWQYFGWAAMITVFLVLSFYCVIAGMTMDYTISTLLGNLKGLDASTAVLYYNNLLSNPWRLMLTQFIFVGLNIWVVAKGVQAGLERSLGWMTPALFIILVMLVIYSALTSEFTAGLDFLFRPDFSRITGKVVLAAFGQAFFSLGIGVGVMLTYGAYMSRETSILSSAAIISFSDGFASILAGLAIFPIVFQYGLSPTEGPGLLFMTLPIAFDQIPGGMIVGASFFLLLFFAAFTSSISLLESIVAHLAESTRLGRGKATALTGLLLWLTGLLTVFSFNWWSKFYPLEIVRPLQGKTIFGIIDYFASNFMMPIGGILMAIIAGWMLQPGSAKEELDVPDLHFSVWRFLIRFVAPLSVLFILLAGI